MGENKDLDGSLDFLTSLRVLPFVLYALLIPLALYPVLIPFFMWQIEWVWSKIAVAYTSLALAGLVISYLAVKERKISFYIPKTAIPFFLLILWGIISTLWSYNPYKVRNLAVMIGPGFLAYIVVLLIRIKVNEIKLIALVIASASAVVSGYGILQLAGVFEMPQDQYGNPNPATTFGLSNFAVEYLLLAFPLSVLLSIAEKGFSRWVFCASSLLTFAYIVGAKNRAGWVGMITFFIFFAIIYILHMIRRGVPAKIVAKYSSAVAGALVVSLYIFLTSTDYGRGIAERFKSFVIVGPGSSVSTRLLTWDAGFDMIAQNPVLGVGAGNYEIFGPKYASRLLDELLMQANVIVGKAHNEYLQIFAELGIVGFSLFILIIFLIFRNYIDIFSRRDDYLFFVATGLFLGIVSLLASASFNFALQCTPMSRLCNSLLAICWTSGNYRCRSLRRNAN